MRRENSAPHGNLDQPDNVGQPWGNPELWVQLGAEGRNIDSTLMMTVQELKDEMARLSADNARLNVEQERILKIYPIRNINSSHIRGLNNHE